MPSTESSTWSEDKWRENILRYQLRVKAETIERLATKLEHAGDFPTDTPSKLSQLIKHTVEILRKHLPDTPADQLTNVNVLLCWIAEHLRFIERSRVASTPWSMVQGTEEFLKRQAGPSTDFIIRPQWSYNYNLIGDFVQAYSTKIQALMWISRETWEDSIGDLAQHKLYCLGFPRIERLNCLFHANWGHEVGHIIAKKWIDSNFDQLWQSEEPQIRRTIEGMIEREIHQTHPPVDPLFVNTFIREITASRVDDTMQAAKDGLTELICDAIGVHLLGPAALAAAIEFSAPLSIDESPLTCDMYPPWRYRIRRMLELCEQDLEERTIELHGAEVKYPGPKIEPFYNWLKETTHLVQNTADKATLDSTITTREAYRVIEANWQHVRQQAFQLLPDESAKPYRLFERVHTIEQLVQKLEQDAPPNEVGSWPDNSPASLEDIWNAAWVFKITRTYGHSGWAPADFDFEKLYRLVLKATEVSFVHNAYGDKLKAVEK